MSKSNHTLSRRQVLGGLGAVGLASAGTGLGTTAFFNDTESFNNNRLEAGELNLKLDYRATYDGGPGRLSEIQAMGYPNAEEIGDGTYLLDQVPDTREEELDWATRANDSFNGCWGDDGDELIDGTDGLVFDLKDVKPGDAGEMTMSFHICDNPAYVWMGGGITADTENGVLENEEGASSVLNDMTVAEDGTVESPGTDGELDEAIYAKLWYDEDCDNIHAGSETGGDFLDAVLVIDTSGSMDGTKYQNAVQGAENFINAIGPNDQVAIVDFDSDATLVQGLTGDTTDLLGDVAIDANANTGGDPDISGAGGSTYIGEGMKVAYDELAANARPTSKRAVIVLTDGVRSSGDPYDPITWADNAHDDLGATIITIGLELSSGSSAVTLLQNMATDPSSNYYDVANAAQLPDVYSTIVAVLTGEEIIVEGSLREVMDFIESGVALDGNRGMEGTQCFSPDYTQCIGFYWELSEEAGNEIQTDAVQFDVKFAAQQCRHNEGTVNPFAA
ncbi:MAG: VWA domain-containing protein [Haloferacaceae archaeon]